jgi:hypothetical protein
MKHSDEGAGIVRKPASFLTALGLGIAAAITSAISALADPITYTMVGTGASGSLQGTMFSDAAVTLTTMMYDTGNVVNLPPLVNPGQPEQVTVTVVQGGGAPTLTATFSDPIWVYINFVDPTIFPPPNGYVVGFFDPAVESGAGSDILDNYSSLFAAYDLTTPIGPISSDMVGPSPGIDFPTTDGGNFVLTNVPATATFTATTSTPTPAPEPSSLALLAVPLAGLAVIRRRKMS